MLNAKICDLRAESPATILLFGKGKKYRQVPLSAKTVGHYKKYLQRFHPGEDAKSREYIFYTIHRGERFRMSDNNVRNFMRRYGNEARAVCPEIPEIDSTSAYVPAQQGDAFIPGRYGSDACVAVAWSC